MSPGNEAIASQGQPTWCPEERLPSGEGGAKPSKNLDLQEESFQHSNFQSKKKACSLSPTRPPPCHPYSSISQLQAWENRMGHRQRHFKMPMSENVFVHISTVPTEARRQCRVPWGYRCRCYDLPPVGAGNGFRSSARAACTLAAEPALQLCDHGCSP